MSKKYHSVYQPTEPLDRSNPPKCDSGVVRQILSEPESDSLTERLIELERGYREAREECEDAGELYDRMGEMCDELRDIINQHKGERDE